MTRFRLVVAEAVRSLGANLSTTFAATTTVLIGMFMLGLVVGLGSWALSLSDHYKKQLLVNVYFCTTLRCGHEASAGSIDTVRQQLLAIPQVKRVQFVSKEEAFAIESKKHPEITANLPGNPLPNTFKVYPKRAEDIDTISTQLAASNPKDVESVCPPAPGSKASKTGVGESCNLITHKVLSVARYLWFVVLIAFVVLLVSSTLLIANTIRLSIFARRREIEVMKLVGATNWFVRGPFMIEGVLAGLAGAVGAVILLLLGRTLFLGHAIHLKQSDVHAWPFGLHVLIVLGAGLALGALGSGLTIRRFLQV
ncbi:MAG TPA: permease-like cell division protein FtsX [Gaiellaceae bacterium]|jgi:cell division transport system permease protein|nr:permease-like cell division protein FtsX [Gaiellaceae bacterium]